ncbi:nuclear transport factor 2 family protein [Streptosporangium sp. NPDC023825]|uniref:nuclear transport factor 2 family protein n=1 Tax=Streptosporangium sp. NPDC023825 TaxID=3154909 RepID=UPI00344A17DD
MGNGAIEKELLLLEEQGWSAISKGDGEFYRRLVTEETLCVEPDGLQTGAELAADIDANPSPFDDYKLEDVKVLPLTGDSAIITYRAVVRLSQTDLTFQLYMTSAYVRHDGGWKLIFHQQTPVKEENQEAQAS